jgi:fatty acid desaturase
MSAPPTPDETSRLAAQRRAGREVMRGIEREVDALHALSAFRRVRETSLFVLLYAVGALLAYRAPGLPMLVGGGILIMGIALNSLPILMHDGLHGVLARDPRANHLLTFLVGLPIGISASAYRVTHGHHHIELGRKRDYGTYRQHLRKAPLIWLAYGLQLLFGSFLYVLLIPPLAFASATARSRMFIVIEYAVIGACFAMLFRHVPPDIILTCWGWPILVMAALTNVRGLGSHALGDVERIYLSSRTIRGSKCLDLLLLHENYHLEHHLFPEVPSYNLAKVHALIWSRLPEALYSRSYAHFLMGFLRAACRGDLTPMGVVRPAEGEGDGRPVRTRECTAAPREGSGVREAASESLPSP